MNTRALIALAVERIRSRRPYEDDAAMDDRLHRERCEAEADAYYARHPEPVPFPAPVLRAERPWGVDSEGEPWCEMHSGRVPAHEITRGICRECREMMRNQLPRIEKL